MLGIRNNHIVAGLAIAMFVGTTGVSGGTILSSGQADALPATHTVTIMPGAFLVVDGIGYGTAVGFAPHVTPVHAGDTVTFVNMDLIGAPHRPWSNDDFLDGADETGGSTQGGTCFRTPIINSGASATITVPSGCLDPEVGGVAGVMSYRCQIHGFMRGELLVVLAA